MDNAASESAVNCFSAYLEEYRVGFQPPVCPAPPNIVFRSSNHPISNLSRSSNRSSHSQSRSRGRKYCSYGTYPAQDLPAAQATALEARIKQMELEDIHQRRKQERQAEECRLLDSQARREAGWLREGFRRARETLTRKLEREQPLAKAEQDLEMAKLHSSALFNGRSPPLFRAPSDNSTLLPGLQARKADMLRFTPQPAQSSQLPLKSTPKVFLPQVVQRVIPFSTVPPTGPQPNLQTSVTLTLAKPATALHGPVPMTPKPVGLPPALALTLPPPSLGSLLPRGRAPPTGAPLCRPPANLVGSSAVYQPTGSSGQVAREIPPPSLPVFESGKESDLVRLKLALDHLLGDDLCLSEQYKYQVLLGQLKLPRALQLAKACMHDSAPYTSALQALKQRYGQPSHLVQAVLNTPALKMGDTSAFYSFASSVQSLVGMLKTLEGQNGHELHCSSHVDCLLSKMPPSYRVDFIEYCLQDGILQVGADRTYTLQDLATWLQMKSQAEQISQQVAALYQADAPRPAERGQRTAQPKEKPAEVWFKHAKEATAERPTWVGPAQAKVKAKPKPYCSYCDRCQHYLNSCKEFRKLNAEQVTKWLKDGKRCRKCGRNHSEDRCTLRRPCKVCEEIHLTVLHEPNQRTKWKVYRPWQQSCHLSKLRAPLDM